MKYKISRMAAVCILSLLAFLAVSCASWPQKPSKSKTLLAHPEIRPDSPDPFGRAIWNVKMNTPLVRKYIEPNASNSTAFSSAADIIVKGQCFIDGHEFYVIYDLAAVYRTDDNHFRIRFSIFDITKNISYYDEFLWQPTEDKAGLLLSFDDDYWNTWRQYLYMLDNFNAKVTFFVQGSIEQEANTDLPKVSSLADFCALALSRGHDLGFHTVNHYDLTKVSPETFNSETIEAAGAFSRAGIPFSAFAFPFGFSNPSIRETLAPVFPTTRGYGTNIRFYNTETIRSGYIISKAIDNIVYRDNNRYEHTILMILITAKFLGDIIVPFTTHDISDQADWGIKPGRLEYLLETARHLRLNFYTYRAISGLAGN